MDARPLLIRIAKMLEQHGLEVVLIGNAAAALQGAPVTTVDFDFMFRKTPVNLRKLKLWRRRSMRLFSGLIIRRPTCSG
jgi:hypothetical protein